MRRVDEWLAGWIDGQAWGKASDVKVMVAPGWEAREC